MPASSKPSPAVSIIIPIYQVRAYIKDCLQSLIDQVNPPPYELLLVDDCGRDDSVELALQFLASTENPPSYRLLRYEANRGLSAARNTGIAAAEGDYLFFLDSDDQLAPDALFLLYTASWQHEADVVIGQTYLMTDNPAWMNIKQASCGSRRMRSRPILQSSGWCKAETNYFGPTSSASTISYSRKASCTRTTAGAFTWPSANPPSIASRNAPIYTETFVTVPS